MKKGNRQSQRRLGYDYSSPGQYFVTVCTKDCSCLFGTITNGIIVINDVGAGPCARPNDQPENGRPRGAAPTQELSLSDVIERFKSLTTTRYIEGVNDAGWQPFRGRLWQRNYHDHIIRNEQELTRIREYIWHNTNEWESENGASN